jgi:LacI family transcriptional regulator
MLLSVVGPDGAEDAYRQMAANGSVDGVMVQGPQIDDPRVPLLQELGLPFLVHGRTRSATDYSWLDVANAAAFRKATDFLLDFGHRRIALVNGQENFDFAARRRAGYEEALTARGVAVDPALMSSDVMTEAYGYAAASAMLDAPDPPTAFVVSSVIPAIGVRRAGGERGLRLGRDIALICHDDVLSYLSNDAEGSAFTATRSSIRAAGARCAEILIDLIRNPGQPPVHELWDAELTVGRSTCPAPG